MRKVVILAFVAIGVMGVGAGGGHDDDGSSHNGARLNRYQEVRLGLDNRVPAATSVQQGHDSGRAELQGHRDAGSTGAHPSHRRSVNGPIGVALRRRPPRLPPRLALRHGSPAAPRLCPCVLRAAELSAARSSPVTSRCDPPATDRGIEAGNWDEFKAAVLVGHAYANVHSARFPGGEIRGQISDRDQKEYTGPPPFVEHDDSDD